jgi:hypothetical protein
VELDITVLNRIEKESRLISLADIRVWRAIVGNITGCHTDDRVNHSGLQGQNLDREKGQSTLQYLHDTKVYTKVYDLSYPTVTQSKSRQLNKID